MPPAGSVGAWRSTRFSLRGPAPKLHRRRRCDGLERSVDLERLWFANLAALASHDESRPCRMCALEEVLTSVLVPTGERRPVFVTFTSQANPNEDLRRFRFGTSTESGQARLVRVARAVGLETASTELGPVAYGFVPRRGATILARNLRTVTRPDITSVPPRAVIEVLWGLLQSNPPELADLSIIKDGSPVDPFALATLLAA